MMRFLIQVFVISLLALPVSACAQDNSVLDIQRVESQNGLVAWLVEDHSIPVISLRFSFKGAGSALDPVAKQGLARIASNTMDEGAGTLKSQVFQKELQDLSINLRFNSSRDHFGGELKTLTRHKARAFELMKLALTTPRFDEEPLARMVAANKSRILSSLSDPNWMAARLLNDVVYDGHPYSLNSGGTLSSLERITPEDLRQFVKTRLGKNNIRIAASGDITAEELTRVMDDLFSTLPEVSLPDISHTDVQNQGRAFLYKKDIPQTIIQSMQPGLARTHPDYHYAQIMNFTLGSSGFGSRLTEEIREKRGLTYGIHTSLHELDHFEGFSVSTSTVTKNTALMIDLIKQEWNKMIEGSITANELKDAQTYLIGALPLSLSSTDTIAGTLLSIQLDNLPINYLDQREEKIKNATLDDIARVTKSLLNPAQFVTVMVGNPEDLPMEVTLVEKLPNVE